MASLNQKPRRSKKNPYPTSQPPLGRWTKDNGKGVSEQVALRADGSLVARTKFPTWTSGWKLWLRGPYTLEKVEQDLTKTGYTRDAKS